MRKKVSFETYLNRMIKYKLTDRVTKYWTWGFGNTLIIVARGK